MSYISEIFERLDIQRIRDFLLDGTECAVINCKPYEERLEDAQKSAFDMIEAKFPDMKEYEKIAGKVSCYTSEVQNVYMEIGMRCGAILATQLLTNPYKE